MDEETREPGFQMALIIVGSTADEVRRAIEFLWNLADNAGYDSVVEGEKPCTIVRYGDGSLEIE